MASDFDLLITGGTIIDGTGAPRRKGDVAVKDGVVVAIGEVTGTAERTIDATGRIVAPGFVDIHTHYDAQLVWDKMMSPSPWHGVTTAVIGNCGFGIAPTRPEDRETIIGTLERVEGMDADALMQGLGDWGFETFPEYLDFIEQRGTGINVGVLVGHTPVRLYVMGADSMTREATPEEIAEMRAIIHEAVDVGAVGIGTSSAENHVGYKGLPVPSRLATEEEFFEVTAPLGELGRGITQITIGRVFNFRGMTAIAERTGQPVSWAALLSSEDGSNGHKRLLEISKSIQAAGGQVYPQVSCRPMQFEVSFGSPYIFESMSHFSEASKGDHDDRLRIYQDEPWKAEFARQLREGHDGTFKPNWSHTVVSYHPPAPELEERLVSDIADERGVDPTMLALDLSLETDLATRFRFSLANVTESEVGPLLRDSVGVLGLSDAGAHASQLCDACFSTHLLGHWVRDKEVLTLEEAVKMLTSRPAEIFGLHDRGLLAVDRPADIVVFDADEVAAGRVERVADLPGGRERLIVEAFGIDAVIVNGTIIREHGKDAVSDDELPGRLLRSGAHT